MKKGFTLIEIMMVVAIITLLAAIAIPNLLRSRISSQEAATAAALYKILLAEDQWRIAHGTYVNLTQLDDATPPYIDAALASGIKYEYNFTMPGFNATNFCIEAVHLRGQGRSFYLDETGILCRADRPGAQRWGYCTAHNWTGYEICPIYYSPVGQ